MKKLAAVLVLLTFVACAGTPPARVAYNSLDEATTVVQTAIKAYKVHCGVTVPGDPGPGTCAAVEYSNAKQAYLDFQVTAGKAAELAQQQGVTPLQVISSAAANALLIINEWRAK